MFIFYVVNRFGKVVQRLLLRLWLDSFSAFSVSTYIFSFDYLPSLFFFDYPVLINLSVPSKEQTVAAQKGFEWICCTLASYRSFNESFNYHKHLLRNFKIFIFCLLSSNMHYFHQYEIVSYCKYWTAMHAVVSCRACVNNKFC